MKPLEIEQKEIDVKATVREVKRQLSFLSDHIWMLQRESKEGTVEEALPLTDFLSYTRSIVKVSGEGSDHHASSAVIEAMERRDQLIAKQQEVRQKTIHQIQLLLTAISYLPENEQTCMQMRFIQHKTLEEIALLHHVSISTTMRICQKAYLHLAQLLNLEVVRETK